MIGCFTHRDRSSGRDWYASGFERSPDGDRAAGHEEDERNSEIEVGAGLSHRQIARSLGVSAGVVASTMSRAKLFVDYAGKKPRLVDRETGEVTEVDLFVAVLGASNKVFAEATATQRLDDWVGSHVRAFEFYGGAPVALVPDQLKSAVSKADAHEPLINRTHIGLFSTDLVGTAACCRFQVVAVPIAGHVRVET